MLGSKNGVFISHLVEESAVALALKETLVDAFGSDLPVFVSTDKESIAPGQPWYDAITNSLENVQAAIVLLSQESCRRPWINFEAGIGVGANISVIPLTLTRFTAGQTPFPIAGMQIYSISDIGIVLHRVALAANRTAKNIDLDVHAEALRKAETAVNYRSLVVTPSIDRQTSLQFDIENVGNADAELLMLEFLLPRTVVDTYGMASQTTIEWIARENGLLWLACYAPRGAVMNVTPCLSPILTSTMGKVRSRLSVPLSWNELKNSPQNVQVSYQLHAVNYQTVRNTDVLSTSWREEFDLVAGGRLELPTYGL
jgi:TIR domain